MKHKINLIKENYIRGENSFPPYNMHITSKDECVKITMFFQYALTHILQ